MRSLFLLFRDNLFWAWLMHMRSGIGKHVGLNLKPSERDQQCYDHSETHSFHTQISGLEVVHMELGHEVSGLYGAPMGALRLLYFWFIRWSFIDKIIVII